MDCTLMIDTLGPLGTEGIGGDHRVQFRAEAPVAGGHQFTFEDQLRVHRRLAVGVEEHVDVAVGGRWPHQRLDFGELVARAGPERHFHNRAAGAQARVWRAARQPFFDERFGLANRQPERLAV